MTGIVLGIDLSLTGLGLCAVPTDWDLRWERVVCTSLGINLEKGASAQDLVRRRRMLAEDVARWASRRNATHAWVEMYPMGGRVFNLDKLAELGGVVKDRLADIGLYVDPVAETTARKLLLGEAPPGRKQMVFSLLQQMGGRFEDTDQADAFTIANYGLSELGAPCIALPPPPKQPKKRKAAA